MGRKDAVLRIAISAGAAALALLVASFCAAPPAWAHGGQFLPPPPDLGPPPDLRPPGERTPPPGGPPAPITPNPGGPPAPVTQPPVGNPLSGPGGGFGGGPRRRGRARTQGGDDWGTWWSLNRLALLPDREAAALRGVVTTGSDGDAHRNDFSIRRHHEAEGKALPFLLHLVDRRSAARDDVVASALLALAKLSTEPDVVALIADRMDDEEEAVLVRESAALALGLIRRSDPLLQAAAGRLDQLRDRLLTRFDDEAAPARVRVFAALAVGLLGDQPFATPYTKDGRLVSRGLWMRLSGAFARSDLPVALLTALGLQPPEGIPDGVRDGLRTISTGRRFLGRRWDDVERSHALTAALRIGGPGTAANLERVLALRRERAPVRRAAYMALGHLAPVLEPEERLEVARLLEDTLRHARDPLTEGLGHIAAGHLLAADLAEGEHGVYARAGLDRVLLSEARSGSMASRGFSILALALACREVTSDDPGVRSFVEQARRQLLDGLDERNGADVRAPHAVAVGLLEMEEAVPELLAIVGDRNAQADLRGHAAVALGQVGLPTPDVYRTLHLAVADRRTPEVARQAALGLALVGGRLASTPLLRELETAETELTLAQVVVALGRLGDLAALDPMLAHARDRERSEPAQALAVVSLGLLLDPEPRASLLRLTQDANYPARTPSLHEAYTIL